jgi:putative phosphoribosyl transferase
MSSYFARIRTLTAQPRGRIDFFDAMLESFEVYRAEKPVEFEVAGVMLAGTLCVPDGARGIVLFAHGSGSSRHSPRNRYVAGVLRDGGVGTLLFDLLTAEEEAVDLRTAHLRFDIAFLARRLVAATDWIMGMPAAREMKIGYFGSSTGGAAALVAACERPDGIRAVVCRGSRPDLAVQALPRVQAPVLFVVGERDHAVLGMNRDALALVRAEKKLEIVPAATHLFEEPGALEQVARLAGAWFTKHLANDGCGASAQAAQ